MNWKSKLVKTYAWSSLVVVLLLYGYLIFKNHYLNGDTKYFHIKQSLNEPYGHSYNANRKSLGIKEIPENWFTYDTSKKLGYRIGKSRSKQDHFWLNQVWKPIDQKIIGHYEKEDP